MSNYFRPIRELPMAAKVLILGAIGVNLAACSSESVEGYHEQATQKPPIERFVEEYVIYRGGLARGGDAPQCLRGSEYDQLQNDVSYTYFDGILTVLPDSLNPDTPNLTLVHVDTERSLQPADERTQSVFDAHGCE